MQIEKSGLADAFAVCIDGVRNPFSIQPNFIVSSCGLSSPLASKKPNNNSSIPRNNNEHHQI